MNRTRGWVLGLISLPALAPAALAQLSARIDLGVGGAPVNQRGTVSLWSLAPAMRYETGRLRIMAEGEYRNYGRSAEWASGLLEASHFTRLSGPVLAELTGSTRTRLGAGTPDGVAWELGGRLHLNRSRTGIWLGGQAGHDLEGRTTRWEAAAWHRFGDFALQFEGSQRSAIRTVRLDQGFPDTLPLPDSLVRNQVRVTTDLGAWLRWAPRRIDVALAVGQRYGVTDIAPGISISPDAIGQNRATSTTVATWWLADATYWLTPRLGVNGAIGNSPPDPQFRAPGGQFLRLAVRATFGREGFRTRSPAARSAGRLVARGSAGVVRLDLTLDGLESVQRVELMGDFTDWLPVEMQRSRAGHWRTSLPIPAGMHFVNVRYDGGPWQPPPGTRVVTDEFERLTGVLVVE